ncbi:response regulator transcription factor [Micromonospora ureilytica]|uniref:response regulator transcription factor n=1 Tax=Micromonospora ureilytica TaxID=709868 RepID=UPI0033DED446
MDRSHRTDVVVVDDHVLVREGVREILEAEKDLTVVGEAGDAAMAVQLVAERRPAVVLLDVDIPGPGAATTVRRMLAASPCTAVIIISMFDGPQLVRALLNAGVRGYLLKSATKHELVAAIRSIRADRTRLVISVSRESLAQAVDPGAVTLSERETEILGLTAEALSNTQIAARLQLSEATVKRHLRNIFTKLGAVSRIDAVNRAVAASLIVRRDGTP